MSLERVELDELDGSDEIEQSGFWGRYKSGFGARPFAFRIGETGRMLVLVRRVAPGFSLGYLPYGPDIADPAISGGSREELLLELGRAARAHLPRGVAFLRFDLPWGSTGEKPPPLQESRGLRKAGVEVQPVHTVILDPRRSPEELLAAMHPKTRYNIGLSARRGVEVIEGSGTEDLASWYAIKVANDRRDGIVTHSASYFEALMRPAKGPRILLLLARVEGRPVGGIIVSFCGKAARYLHGASSDEARNTMYSYALQWRAVELAREAGCSSYDLYGIPPDDDPTHPMHGLYRFKMGFGGDVLHRLGCYDVVLHQAVYAASRLPEQARYFYYKRLRRLQRSATGRGDRQPRAPSPGPSPGPSLGPSP